MAKGFSRPQEVCVRCRDTGKHLCSEVETVHSLGVGELTSTVLVDYFT